MTQTYNQAVKSYKRIKSTAEYPLQEVLAVAYAAQRINGQYKKYTQRFSEPANQTQFSNKEIVKFHFGNTEYHPDDWKGVQVVDQDYDMVKDTLEHFKTYTLKALSGELTEFQRDVYQIVSNTMVPRNKLGLAAYIPELISRDIKESKLKRLIRTEYRNSVHIGKEKDNIEGNIKILRAKYSERWESWNYLADYMGNLVSFMKNIDLEEGKRYNVKAKVKDHVTNSMFGVDETRINYIKLKKATEE